MPDNLIQKARQLSGELNNLDLPLAKRDRLKRDSIALLPLLVDLVERSQAQAIESRAAWLFLDEDSENYYPGWEGICEDKQRSKKYLDQAAKELADEASSWHKITEAERKAIHRAIRAMEDANFHHSDKEKDACKVLRSLL